VEKARESREETEKPSIYGTASKEIGLEDSKRSKNFVNKMSLPHI
jgi:hypothetical protein